ncbi:MAG: amidohydrolase family protein [Desulfobulbaceae bacterium]|nr:amidohydrolase family protein [Desulfobulbaceae bacterium]
MRIDMHVHIADVGSIASGAQPPFLWSNGILARILHKVFFSGDSPLVKGTSNTHWENQLSQWVKESQIDKVVLLALDKVYDKDGHCQNDTTRFSVKNDLVLQSTMGNDHFLFGASIHPYRKDAINILEKVVSQGACLIKWIPSAQYIEPDDSRCLEFYEAMAHHGIPLLSHTGVEHSLGCRRTPFNHPDRLIPALKKGVNVIAAHCGTRLFLHEKSFFHSWCKLARRHENCFGDLSALPVITRIPALRKIFSDTILQQKVVYGSDFPSFSSPLWCWQLGAKQILRLSKISNPIERNYRVMQTLGVPDAVFRKAHSILKC